MRNFLMVTAVGLFLATPTIAKDLGLGPGEQAYPHTASAARAFVTEMDPDAWQRIINASLDGDYFRGKEVIAFFNPFDEAVTTLVCDKKYNLIGTNAYNDNPKKVGPKSFTILNTHKFGGGWCADPNTGLLAITDSGERHHCRADNEDFTAAKAITCTLKAAD